MAKELIVEGKKYLPSTTLAGQFSYTTDYLSKLAREGKIEATRVGRQWFLSVESLQEFIAATNERKAKRNQSLREERVKERRENEIAAESASSLLPITKNFAHKKNAATSPVADIPAVKLPSQLESLLATAAVSLCLCLVAVLGFVMVEQNVTVERLSSGLNNVATDMATAFDITPDTNVEPDTQVATIDFSSVWRWLFGGVEIEREVESEQVELAHNEAAAIKPVEVKNAMLMLDPTTSTTTAKEIRESFSDEVEVEFDGPDTGIIKPVFKEKTEESYRFLLVPVVEAGNE